MKSEKYGSKKIVLLKDKIQERFIKLLGVAGNTIEA